MNTEQLMTLCQRHHALLLASDTDMISIAVVGNPASGDGSVTLRHAEAY